MTDSEKTRHIRLRSYDHHDLLCEKPGLLIPIQTEIFSYFRWKDVLEYWKQNKMCDKCTRIFRDHVCSQYPLCYTCESQDEVTLRICPKCYLFEWDELQSCDCDLELVHDCKSNTWNCEAEICTAIDQAEYENSVMDDYYLEQAGGLDAVQERQRRDYYVGKYGEY